MSLRLRGLTKRFGRVVAVDDVSLTIGEGETLALLGPSGCGKSTLLRLIAGLERPDAGRLEFGGQDVTDVPPQLRDVGMVFQAYALFPHLDVAANVAFGLVEDRVPERERRKRTAELLALVGLSGLESRRVDQLSGGQQQRVALARALAPDPALLLLDEPLSNLDEQLREGLKDELGRLLGQLGKRAVYVTHDQTEAFTLADRVALMRAGRIVQVGTGEELLDRPASAWAARFLGHDNVFEATVGLPGQGLPSADSGSSGRGTSGVPDVGSGTDLLFRADLARLLPPAADVPAGAGSHVEVVVAGASREGLEWRLDLEAPAWGVNVVWRGFDRELAQEPAPGARLLLVAPAGAWRVLPGEGTQAEAAQADPRASERSPA